MRSWTMLVPERPRADMKKGDRSNSARKTPSVEALDALQLFLATIMSLVTVIIHLTGLAFLVRTLRSRHRLVKPVKGAPVAVLLIATATIFAIHTAEVWLYALLYLLLGALDTFEVALYFSTVTYSSLGYGDVVLEQNWRIFGAIEGAPGILMMGWSTAFLVSMLGQLRLLTHDWLTRESAGDA